MLENTTNISIEQLVEIVGVTTGSVIAVGKGILSFCELISSYNIEIGLMTKKEQWKFRITNLAMLTFSIWLLNVLFCFVCSDERVICVVFLCCMIIFLIWGISCLLLVVMWLLNKRKTVLINTNVEGYVRVLCFVAFLLFGITFNDCLVFYGTEKYNVWIGSFLMTVLIMEMFIWAIFIRKTHKPLFCCGHQPTASWELSSIYSAIRRNSSAYLNFTLMFPPS